MGSVVILGFVASVALAASGTTSSPTCTLSVSPTPIELLKPATLNIVWTSNGADTGTLKVDAWSQPNIYTTTGINGNINVPVTASMGLEATLTVTRNNPYAVSTCNTQIPVFWVPKK